MDLEQLQSILQALGSASDNALYFGIAYLILDFVKFAIGCGLALFGGHCLFFLIKKVYLEL